MDPKGRNRAIVIVAGQDDWNAGGQDIARCLSIFRGWCIVDRGYVDGDARVVD